MGKLSDVAIRAWIRSGERFECRSDSDGLALTWRPERSAPSWKLRYRFAGRDVAGEKQERKSTALARIEAARSATTVRQLADEYFKRMINGRWKHPNIVRNRIEKDI